MNSRLQSIKFCKKCVAPNTRPRISFDEDGICNACSFVKVKKKQTGMKGRMNSKKF